MSNVKLYQSGAVIHQQGHIKLHFLTGAVMDQGTFSPTKLVPFPANLNPQGRIMPPSLAERYRGALLGLACGDAVGTTVEFKPRGSFQPLTDMVGGGPFHLKPGQWTDDTSMALCLAESLLNKNGFNAADQMGRYLNWWQWGYLSSTGECFDIGMTVSQALAQFQQNAEPFAGSADPYSAGNGSLMRLAPVVLFYFPDARQIQSFAADSSRTTHAAPEAIECCQLLAGLIASALEGASKAELRQLPLASFSQPKVASIGRGDFLGLSEADIKGSGYSVQSLEAALWCFHHTDSFEAAILRAANLGDDADTTAAITGQLAGAYYGVRGIPEHWLEKLHDGEEIAATADRLLDASRLRLPE
jgi:ADP-ribosyl-[dinitrogen reductase] hydrolase